MDRSLRSGCAWFTVHRSVLSLAILASIAPWGTDCASAGELSRLRDDVRSSGSSDDDESSHKKKHESDDDDQASCEPYAYAGGGGSDRCGGGHHGDDVFEDGLAAIAVRIAFGAVVLPVMGPRGVCADDNSIDGYFPRFPYENHGRGYLLIDNYTSEPRLWAVRLRSDYAENGGDLSQISGHLLLSTTTRWGIDTEMSRLRERLDQGQHDQLWLGDCNVVYRFAQSERAEWRTGIGFNWLDDPIETDYGFNFTYGFDFYPVRPLVLSTELDWGTLGRAEAFHFRTTAGVVINRFETYVGYEYRDIDRFQFSGLVAGVRLWF